MPTAWLPQPEDAASADWRYFSNDMFYKVFWTYAKSYPVLSANGIVIDAGSPYGENISRISMPISYIKCPKLSVFDKDGYLPVDLQSTGLRTRILPFQRDLVRSIADDLMSHALGEGPFETCEGDWFQGTYEGFARSYAYPTADWARWFIGKDGFVLNDAHLLNQVNPSLVIVALGGLAGYQAWGDKVRDAIPATALMASYLPESLAGTNPRIKGIFRSAMEASIRMTGAEYNSASVCLPKALVSKIRKLSPGKKVSSHLDTLDKAEVRGDWLCLLEGNPDHSKVIDAITALSVDPDNPTIFYLFEPHTWDLERFSDLIAERWLEVLGTPVIPFEAERRLSLESKAVATLGELLRLRRERAVFSKDVEKNDESLLEEEDS